MIAKLKYRKNETDEWRVAILVEFYCKEVIKLHVLGKSNFLKNEGYYFQIEWKNISAFFYGVVLEKTDKKITVAPTSMIDLV